MARVGEQGWQPHAAGLELSLRGGQEWEAFPANGVTWPGQGWGGVGRPRGWKGLGWWISHGLPSVQVQVLQEPARAVQHRQAALPLKSLYFLTSWLGENRLLHGVFS